ncbi:2' O-ribose methyltransferase [Elasticomyces elasticus]|nr:2' O-ribose methyltransferase [Elasticomyces elasticus]KAK5034595.1 2' O-ribose methyltransferase [Exophiala sideris]
MDFRKSFELLTLLGGAVLIVVLGAVTIIWTINKADQQSYDSLDNFYGYLERSEKISQQQSDVARLQKMDDEDLETIAAAAAKEIKQRRKHAYSSTSPSLSSRSPPASGQRFASSKRWTDRQRGDSFARAAKVQGLKSRAAFKLLQINDKYRLFKPGMTVVDLGFAPGSWSQVAIDMTKPRGRVLGIDLIPVQPPKGVSTIQGDFLSPDVQAEIKSFLRDPDRGRLRRPLMFDVPSDGSTDGLLEDAEGGYVEREAHIAASEEGESGQESEQEQEHLDKTVDVVLSDMSEPWDPLDGLYKRSISNPYYRLMNTSGNAFRDHAGSMDLCRAALQFSYDTLKVGGHFVCKFYQGVEDKALEKSLRAMFHKVHREKPDSSRSESKEAYFVGIKRMAKVDKNAVFADG